MQNEPPEFPHFAKIINSRYVCKPLSKACIADSGWAEVFYDKYGGEDPDRQIIAYFSSRLLSEKRKNLIRHFSATPQEGVNAAPKPAQEGPRGHNPPVA